LLCCEEPIHKIVLVLVLIQVLHALHETSDAKISGNGKVGELDRAVGVLPEKIVKNRDLANLLALLISLDLARQSGEAAMGFRKKE